MILFPVFPTGIVDTGGKFATSSNEANDIGQWIFENIWNDPNAIIRGLGENDSQKNQKQKYRDAIPLNFQ